MLTDSHLLHSATKHINNNTNFNIKNSNILQLIYLAIHSYKINKIPFITICKNQEEIELIKQAIEFIDTNFKFIAITNCHAKPFCMTVHNKENTALRVKSLHNIVHQKNIGIILITATEAKRKLPPKSFFKNALTLKKGQKINLITTLKTLETFGYEKATITEKYGQFCQRGTILDIFSPKNDNPFRIDIFEETIESIRIFKKDSQISAEKIGECTIIPAQEYLLTKDSYKKFEISYIKNFGYSNLENINQIKKGLSLFGQENWLYLFYERMSNIFNYVEKYNILYFCQLSSTLEKIDNNAKKNRELNIPGQAKKNKQKAHNKKTEDMPNIDDVLLNNQEFYNFLHQANSIIATNEEENKTNVIIDCKNTNIRDFSNYILKNNKASYLKSLTDHIAENKNKKIILSLGNNQQIKNIFNHLKNKNINIHNITSMQEIERSKTGVFITNTITNEGFVTKNYNIITDREILNKSPQINKIKPLAKEQWETKLKRIKKGDYVTHINHGVGLFEDIKTIKINNAPRECLIIRYKNNCHLYLPVENIDYIKRYGNKANIDTLGSSSFAKRKQKIKDNLLKIAKELTETSAKRKLAKAPKISISEDIMTDFINSFEFEDTKGQINCTEDVLDDLKQGTPMDRIICADVGFGKTEIAIRACFATILNGYQAAILVPTTLLCQQHLKTFKKRLDRKSVV